MAIAADAKSSSSGTGTSSLTWSHTCTGTDLILVVGVETSSAEAATGVTYNGIALTLIDAQDAAALFCRSELWYLIAPATGANDIVVTMAGSATYIVGGATSWTGVDQSTPLGTAAKATGSASPATVDVTSAAGEVVLDAACAIAGVTMTVGASQTSQWNLLAGGVLRGAGSSEGGAGTVTISWTLSASALWATVAVPIKPGTGGGGAGETTASEIWVIPSRTEPFAIAENYAGLLAQALASRFPHLLAWRLEGTKFIWHDLGPLPAYAQLDAMAVSDVAVGSGVDPGLTLFGVEAHDSVVLTSLAASALGAAQRRYPDPGGAFGTDSGVLFGSRLEFDQPHRLQAVRFWGENFQAADIVRFAYRWDRGRWYSIGEIHGLPAQVPVSDDGGGLFLEWVVGFTDKNAWEPTLPSGTRIDALVETIEIEPQPEADTQVPEVD